jgi:hypothetical protein
VIRETDPYGRILGILNRKEHCSKGINARELNTSCPLNGTTTNETALCVQACASQHKHDLELLLRPAGL